MELFSHRKGIEPLIGAVQIDSVDSSLRNGLWSGLCLFYWDRVGKTSFMRDVTYHYPKDITMLINQIWLNHFKKPIDELSSDWAHTRLIIKKYFYNCEWYHVYNFIEFVVNICPDEDANESFINFCNNILERDNSAYRFVDTKISQITSEEEIAEIEEAITSTEPLAPVNSHLKSSLSLLSDRTSPDYRNSIKESISAVESLCKLITGDTKATLGPCLKAIEKKVELHGALKSAFSSIYGYTSDAGGIRHALLEEENLDFEDAKFMLVSCSAFINYLIVKASKTGIDLTGK